MKFFRWVEVHIGRTRRKNKKEKEGCYASDLPRRREESIPGTPLYKSEAEPPATRSASNTPRHAPLSACHKICPPKLYAASNSPLLGAFASSLDTGSPRQRSRIRTNPWLPSPRTSSRGGSPSVFSSESASGEQPCWRSKSPPPLSIFSEEASNYRRSIPRSSWVDFRQFRNTPLAAEESSDEAYSEDYGEEDEPSVDSQNEPHETGSPQADSACGSDRDHSSSSCSTTPMSETAMETKRPNLLETHQILHKNIQRLHLEKQVVHKRVLEAREETLVGREERNLLRRELVQFRRLILLQTLTELRDQLERCCDNPSVHLQAKESL